MKEEKPMAFLALQQVHSFKGYSIVLAIDASLYWTVPLSYGQAGSQKVLG